MPRSDAICRALFVALAGLLFAAPALAQSVDQDLIALTTSNRLVRLSTVDTCATEPAVKVTGLQPDESLLGIDVRPATGELYGLGSSSRLYRIDPFTGQATAVGVAPFVIPLSGTAFGFDFNPTVDRIRIVSNTGQNLRAHPDLGTVVDFDAIDAGRATRRLARPTMPRRLTATRWTSTSARCRWPLPPPTRIRTTTRRPARRCT